MYKQKYTIEALKTQEMLQKEITEIFFAKEVKLITGKKPYIHIELSDSSGSITGKIWAENINENYLKCKSSLVRITGTVSTYQGEFNIAPIVLLEPVNPKEIDANPADFFVSLDHLEAVWKQFKIDVLKVVKKPHLVELFNVFFGDEDSACVKKFKRLQGGVANHHVAVGGWLKHTHRMVQLGLSILDLYSRDTGCFEIHKNFDPEILILGIALHDVGKWYSYKSPPINERTPKDILWGHVPMGAMMIYSAIKDKSDFPETDFLKLIHCVLASHGEIESSPVKPMCLEALIVSSVDDMDARIDSFNQNIKAALVSVDEKVAEFTPYDRLFERYFFKE